MLQVVDVIRDILPLPSWLAPGLLAVLSLGFVFVVATAWIHADPDVTRREHSGELPRDWQIAPKDALGALQRGNLPHLTWGRTLLAGFVALSLLFGAAGLYVLTSNGVPDRPGDDDGISVAAMPFTTSGPGLDVYREGMVEMLSTNLDGLGDIRSISSRTVLARWDDLGDVKRPDLTQVLKTANTTGATHAVVGNVIAVGPEVRITSQLFDLRSHAELTISTVQGPAAEILSLVDKLSVAIARALLGSEQDIEASGSRLASLTTTSVPALRLYLQAEAFYRRGAFHEALPLLDQAVEADPSFGLAVMRRAQAFGWLPRGTIPLDTLEASRRAIEPLLGGMSKRDATLARAGIVAFANRDPDGPRLLREFVTRYADDAEGWFQLSDFLFHLNDIRGGTQHEVLGGFDRAVQLAPRFVPYYIHATDAAIVRGDSARARELIARYKVLASEDDRWRQWVAGYAARFDRELLSGEDSARAAASIESTRMLLMSDRPDIIADLSMRYFVSHDPRRIRALLRAGRWEEARRAVGALSPAGRDAVVARASTWIGSFGLDRSKISLIVMEPVLPSDGPDFWSDDAAAQFQALLTARDNGSGADPALLAISAVRAGKNEEAEILLGEESWREFGPAMMFRLAKLYESTGRAGDALDAYRHFLDLWRSADHNLPPVIEAKAKVAAIARP